MNSRVKTLSVANPRVFTGMVAPGVAKVGSLFERFRASIWKICPQKVHRTVARARLIGAIWEDGAPDCSESSVSQAKLIIGTFGAAPDLCAGVRAVDAARRDAPPVWACNRLQQDALARL